jgi:ABC-type branched-subunit amino acid transport system substrate-binding protein
MSRQEACGKKIYFQGTDCAGRKIKAFLGDMEISAGIETCSRCHGADGKGRPESGVDPGDIAWEHLSLGYGHSHATGRTHPAFTEQTFYRAVTQGIDPANHKLSTLMPRFRMSARQLTDLFAYLKRLSTDFDPGVDTAGIAVGSLLPERGGNAETGNIVKAVLSGYFDEVNQHGGIYGRKIVLYFGEATADRVATLANARRLIDTPVFAMIAPLAPGMEKDLAALADQGKLPVVGPLTLSVQEGSEDTFYVLPGLRQLAMELIRWANEHQGIHAPGAAIVFSGNKLRDEVASALEDAWKGNGLAMPQEFDYFPGNRASLIEQLQRQGIESVFFAGSGADALAWMQASHDAGWAPQMFLFGPLQGEEVLKAPEEFQGHIHSVYPAAAGPAESTPEFDAFARRHQLPQAHRVLQIWAYCAAKIFEDALTRAGGELSREKFVHSIEQIHQFRTGVLPEITFGVNRRVGSTKLDVLCADLKSRSFQSACVKDQE